jgi:hypothetical protein
MLYLTYITNYITSVSCPNFSPSAKCANVHQLCANSPTNPASVACSAMSATQSPLPRHSAQSALCHVSPCTVTLCHVSPCNLGFTVGPKLQNAISWSYGLRLTNRKVFRNQHDKHYAMVEFLSHFETINF